MKIISKNDKDFNFNKLLNSNGDKEYILDAYTYAEEIENYQKQISTTNEGIGVLISKLFKTVIIICDEFKTPKDIPDIIEVITNLITNDKNKNDLPFVSFTEEKFTSYEEQGVKHFLQGNYDEKKLFTPENRNGESCQQGRSHHYHF